LKEAKVLNNLKLNYPKILSGHNLLIIIKLSKAFVSLHSILKKKLLKPFKISELNAMLSWP
jgi:hypothetical protein